MAIKVCCEVKGCGKELEQFGALLFGLEGANGKAKKHHSCIECYPRVRKAVLAYDPYEYVARLYSAPNSKGYVRVDGMERDAYESIARRMFR